MRRGGVIRPGGSEKDIQAGPQSGLLPRWRFGFEQTWKLRVDLFTSKNNDHKTLKNFKLKESVLQ